MIGFKVVLGADFLVQVVAFLRQAFARLGNLLIIQCVFDADGNLIRHLGQEIHIFLGESPCPQAP